MSRHSKNNTAHSIFTYYERKKLKGSGTLKTRFSGEALRRFEDCWLCLRPALKPVSTLGGYIYCRDCLMSNLASQKEANDSRHLQWELEQRKKTQQIAREKHDIKRLKIQSFIDANEKIAASSDLAESSSSMDVARHSQLVEVDKASSRAQSFWIAENTPDSSLSTSKLASSCEAHVNETPPSRHLFCPISKQRLRLKDLVTLQPEIEVSDTELKNDKAPEIRWICAITKKQIGCQRAVAIKVTGQVVLVTCQKDGLLKGFVPGRQNVTERDLVPLIPGGTGFASHNRVEAQMLRPVME